MSEDLEYETELTATRDEIAATLRGVADGITAGSIRLGDGADAIRVDAPEEITLEIELETDDDELSLELEMEWPNPENGEHTVSLAEDSSGETIEDSSGETIEDSSGETIEDSSEGIIEDSSEEEDELGVPAGAANATQTLAQFEVFRDRGDEWRWRLRHRNGNVIATSGEGYTRKHNAQKGLRSVVQNAPEAEVVEDSEK